MSAPPAREHHGTRTVARKLALQALYRWQLNACPWQELLQEFAIRGVNLMRIESRPTGEGLGRYCFSVDAEGHLTDRRVGEALMGLRRRCLNVRFLGSHPRADGVRAKPRLAG